MILAKIRINGVKAMVLDVLDIPVGIIGGTIVLEYADPIWDGLTKTVVFRGCVTKDVVDAGDVVEIPPEVVSRAGVTLHVGVYGTDGDNSIAIPTLWADLGRVRPAADPSGDTSTDHELPVWAQLEGRVKKLELAGPGTGGGGYVPVTINGESPDENGNFIISTVSDVEIAQLSAALV